MVNPRHHRAKAKRARIMRLLNQGALVGIQETHWTEADAGVWASQFPLAKVVAAPDRPGPAGGAQGGVALVLPRGWEPVRSQVVVPGCCLDVT
eukprot:15483045-Alexandrium_andersonii.AAC.1